MTNPIFKAYQTLDDTIMKGVNAGVRAWNWTTGDTKAGLANKMQILGMAFMSIAPLLREDKSYLKSAMMASLFVPVSYIITQNNKRLEVLEEDSANKNSLNIEVELQKNYSALFGPALLVASGVCELTSSKNTDQSSEAEAISFGSFLYGLSNYVMRTDSLPPRKDCISRGIERLVETYKNYQEQRATIPQLARQQRLWGLI